MFLIQQRVEHAFALLLQTYPPLGWAHRMKHNRVRCINKRAKCRGGACLCTVKVMIPTCLYPDGAIGSVGKSLPEPENEIAILSPCRSKVLIKTSNRFQTRTAIKAVGGDKCGVGELRRVAFVIRRGALHGYNELPRYAENAIQKSSNPGA